MAQYKILVKDGKIFKLNEDNSLGTITYPNGGVYAGEIKNYSPIGHGVYLEIDSNNELITRSSGKFESEGKGLGRYFNYTGELNNFKMNDGLGVLDRRGKDYSGKFTADGKQLIGKKEIKKGVLTSESNLFGIFDIDSKKDFVLNGYGVNAYNYWGDDYEERGLFKNDSFSSGKTFIIRKDGSEVQTTTRKGEEFKTNNTVVENARKYSTSAKEKSEIAKQNSDKADSLLVEAQNIAKEADKQQAYEAEKTKATPNDVDFKNVGTVILDNHGAKYEGTLNKDGKPYGYGTITLPSSQDNAFFQGSFVDANNMFGRYSYKQIHKDGFFGETTSPGFKDKQYYKKSFETFSSIPKEDVDAFVKLAVDATAKVRSRVVIHPATEYDKIIKENKETGSTTGTFVFGKKVGDGEYYTGQTNSKGDPHGLGSIMHKYTGRFVHGKFDGLGKKTSDDESFYGVFKNDKLKGIGLYWKNLPLSPDKYIFSTGFDGKNYPEVDQNGGLLNYLKEKVECEINNKKKTKERLLCDVENFVKEINELKQKEANAEYKRIFDNAHIPEKASDDLSIISDKTGNLYEGGVDNDNKYHGFGKLTIKSSIEGYHGNCHVFTGYFKNGSIVVGKYESSSACKASAAAAVIKNNEKNLFENKNALVTTTNQVKISGLKQKQFEQKNITKYIGFFENFKPSGMGKMFTLEQKYGFVSNSFESDGVKIDEYSYGTSPSLVKVIEKNIVKDIEEKVIKKAEDAVNQVNTKLSSESKTADKQLKEITDLAKNENPNKKYVVINILSDGVAKGFSKDGKTIDGTAIITLDKNNSLGLPEDTELTVVINNGTYVGAALALLPNGDKKEFFFINGENILLSGKALVTTTSESDIIKQKVRENLQDALKVLHKNSIMLNEKVLNLDTKKNDIQSVVLNFLKETNTPIQYSEPGRSYSGQLDQNGKPNGHGTITIETEKKNRFFGKSKEITTITGNFLHGVPNGKMEIKYPDGSKFVGEIRDKTGWGTLTKSTGEIFTGLVDVETGKPGDTGVSVNKDSTNEVNINGKSVDSSLGPELFKIVNNTNSTNSSDTTVTQSSDMKADNNEKKEQDTKPGWGLKEYGLASAAAALGTAGIYYAYKKYKQSAKPKSKSKSKSKSRRRSKSPEKQSSPKRRTSKKRKRSPRSGSRSSAKRSSASE